MWISEDFIELILALTTNITGMFILCLLVNYAMHTFSVKNRINRFLYLLFGVSFCELATHLLTTVAQYYVFWGINCLGRVMYSLVFVVNSIFLFSWILYLDHHMTSLVQKNHSYKKKLILLSLPVMILLVLSIVNMFTPVYFSYNNFVYDRWPMYYLTLFIPIGYLVYGVAMFVRSKRRRRIYQQLPFIQLLLPVVLSHILESTFILLCCIPLANVITLMILVLTNVKQYSSVDGMTGLFTRRELYSYLEGMDGSPKNLVGIMLDLDHFKSINDTYGHLTGDDALSDFGYVLRNSIPGEGIAYRYAGDEFIVLLPGMKEQDAKHVAENLYQNLAQFNLKSDNVYSLEASFGISEMQQNDTANSFIERMDHRMYRNKQSKR